VPYWDVTDKAITPIPVTEARGMGFTMDNPAVSRYIHGTGGANYSGEVVSEASAMSLSAIWRAGSLISQAIATLPLKTYRTLPDGERERVASFLDDPCGPESDGDQYLTPFEWKERVCLHLFYQGEAFLYHRRNAAGALVGLWPVHPLAVSVNASDTAPGGKTFDVALRDGEYTRDLTTADMTHILGPCTRGLRGYSILSIARNSLGMTQASERSAAEQFANGATMAGAFTPRAESPPLSTQDVDDIQADLDRRLYNRGGKIPVINRILEFQPWSMTNADAQYLESRSFQIEEVARWTGVFPYLLMQVEKQTSWGTGLSETNSNLRQYVLLSYTGRIEERVSRLLSQPRFAEFDPAGFLAGSPSEQISLGMAQVNGGVLTLNEYRRIQNLPPLPGGDQLRIPSGVMLQAQLEASAAKTEAEVTTEQAAPDGA
jgi:HK97 family phage portal protein